MSDQPISFSIDIIIRGDLALNVDPPINIQHKYSTDDPKLIIADEPVLGMHLWGASIDELREAAEDEIVFLWKEFVERTDETLSESALKLRNTLKSRIKRLSLFRKLWIRTVRTILFLLLLLIRHGPSCGVGHRTQGEK